MDRPGCGVTNPPPEVPEVPYAFAQKSNGPLGLCQASVGDSRLLLRPLRWPKTSTNVRIHRIFPPRIRPHPPVPARVQRFASVCGMYIIGNQVFKRKGADIHLTLSERRPRLRNAPPGQQSVTPFLVSCSFWLVADRPLLEGLSLLDPAASGAHNGGSLCQSTEKPPASVVTCRRRLSATRPAASPDAPASKIGIGQARVFVGARCKVVNVELLHRAVAVETR